MMNAETIMNLIGLILIAALSGVIVAVSLRLRASASARFRLEERGLHGDDRHRRDGEKRFQDPLDATRESGIYLLVKKQLKSLLAEARSLF